MAEAFNIEDISKIQDRFESIIDGKMAFSGRFVGG